MAGVLGSTGALFYFLDVYLRDRETERDRVRAEKGQRERETQNLKQVPDSVLPAESPMKGSNS